MSPGIPEYMLACVGCEIEIGLVCGGTPAEWQGWCVVGHQQSGRVGVWWDTSRVAGLVCGGTTGV